ncbi:MAG: hypothetical protein N3G78_11295, partial [Desulfobacterota bacterium]|nr:hypothetical protein [Thermodesulfobacteriota bacterium]
MSRRKNHPQEEHENHERWLVSYADFITLLFAFFVTMYACSRADGQKMGSAIDSFQKALGSVIPIALSHKEPGIFPDRDVPIHFSLTPIEGKAVPPKKMAFVKMAKEIEEAIQKLPNSHGASIASNLNEKIKFILEDRGLVIRISEGVFFNSGEATIRQEMKPILDILGRAFEKISNPV